MARTACAHVATLSAGEILIIPANWWHSSLTLSSFRIVGSSVSSSSSTRSESARATSPPSSGGGNITLARTFANQWNQSEADKRHLAAARRATRADDNASLEGIRAESGGVARTDSDRMDEDEDNDDPTRDVYRRAEGHASRGKTEFARGRYREATEAFTKAIDLVRNKTETKMKRK
jgi:hypothetical protein